MFENTKKIIFNPPPPDRVQKKCNEIKFKLKIFVKKHKNYYDYIKDMEKKR